MTRNAKISLMAERGQKWRKLHPQKTVQVRIQNNHLAYHGLLRLRIDDAAEMKEIFCNDDGWEFLRALDPANNLQPTVAMLLAVLEKLNEKQTVR